MSLGVLSKIEEQGSVYERACVCTKYHVGVKKQTFQLLLINRHKGHEVTVTRLQT